MTEPKEPLKLMCKCCWISAYDYFVNLLNEKVPESLDENTIWYCSIACYYGRTAHD